MTVIQLYLEFLTKVNKLGTYEGRYFSPDKFVLLWNDQQQRWLEHSLQKKGDSSELQDLQFLFRTEYPLVRSGDTERTVQFIIPEIHQLAGIYVTGRSGTCTANLTTRPLKHPANLEELWNDWCNEPNWEYRETFYTISEDKLLVYRKGFDIDRVSISYWRPLNPIDIEGYEGIDGDSQNIDPEPIGEFYLRQILDLVVAEYYRITPVQGGLETAKDRISTSEKENF